MDIVTQGLLGSTLAQSTANKQEIRLAALIGFAAGLLADADVFIRSSSDSLLSIEYHRHFTHSVFFIPFGALFAAVLLFPFLRKRISFKRLYLFSLLGYSLSGFLDLCTSYGTYFFWPLLNERLALHIISILDPVFSLILVISILFCLLKQKAVFARVGLLLAGAYLLFGYVQMQRATAVVEELVLQRGHQYERIVVKPTIFNLIVWRSIYENEGYFYIDAVRVGLSSRVYIGESIRKFDLARELPELDSQSILYDDIRRFEKFSDDYVAWSPVHSALLGDVRYAMLPNGLRPLWGIALDVEQPGQHAQFISFRNVRDDDKQAFIKMLMGK